MEILIILLLSIVNGVFSMAELAVVSARKSRLELLAEAGDKRARAALNMMLAPNRFFSTVQIAITLIGTAAGVFGGTTVAAHLKNQLDAVPALLPYSEAIAVTVVVALTTYLSLVLGELVPKRIAMRYPEAIALAITAPMNLITRLTSPVVSLLSLSTDAILHLLRIEPIAETAMTEAEVLSLIEQGVQAGIFGSTEPRMVEGVFRLDEIRINAVMTPRKDLIWLDVDAPESEIRATLIQQVYSAYPVYQYSQDNPLGMVHAKDLLNLVLSGQSLDVSAVIRKVPFIPETTLVAQVLEMFKTSGVHAGLVVDEYGGVNGLLTMYDLLEEIIGDLQHDTPDILQREDGSWLIDGGLSMHRLQEVLSRLEIPEEETGSYSTLSGFVLMRMGRIPSPADHFVWDELRFEVVDMDGNRIDKVLVQRIQSSVL